MIQMKSQQIALGVVGLLIGFVFGFFLSQYLQSAESSQAVPVAAVAEQGQLPEGHPPLNSLQEIESLEAHAQEHPEHVEVKIQLGNAYFDMHRFEEAIKWYEKAQELQPENVQVNNDLGVAYYASGNMDRSVQILERSLQMDKDQPVALMNLGWIYFTSDQFEKAISYWERLVQAHPQFQKIDDVKEQLEKARSHLRGEHS